jgi:hypothetical protein
MPPLKPPARARRFAALRRRGGQAVLTSHAIEELFRRADVLTEGRLGGDTWYGSIMITFHLDRLAESCRGLEGAEALDPLVEAILGSVRVRLRAHRLACAQVYARHPDRHVGTAQLESRFRREGNTLLLDIDLEAPAPAARNEGRAPGSRAR